MCEIAPPDRTVASVDSNGVWSHSTFPDPTFGAPPGFNPVCPTIVGETFAAPFDGNDCLIGTALAGQQAYVGDGAFYYDVDDDGVCSYLPYDDSALVTFTGTVSGNPWTFDACFVADIPDGFDG